MIGTISLSNIKKIKLELIKSLKRVSFFERCALLNYPNYGNIGDHLIGLGTVLYLIDEAKINISYVASIKNFSSIEMENNIGSSPILLQGGGNLGDLWYEHQQFREYIISKYHKNPIIILPQTIYFKNQGCLKKARNIFNKHPNLTIFVRDNYSYELAKNHFSNAQILLAPDMAFYLADIFTKDSFKFLKNRNNKKNLYLKRKDKEFNPLSTTENFKVDNFNTEDWISYKSRWLLEDVVEEYIKRKYQINLSGFISMNIRLIVRLYREIWQRMLNHPLEYLHRTQWTYQCSESRIIDSLQRSFMYQLSLSLSYSGAYQLSQHNLVITTRLHGHILCSILEIPNILLANSYHKNQAFYETWTYGIPFNKFLYSNEKIDTLIQELNTFN